MLEDDSVLVLLSSRPYDGITPEQAAELRDALGGTDRVLVQEDPDYRPPRKKKRKKNKTIPRPNFHDGNRENCSSGIASATIIFGICSTLALSL